MSEISEDAMAPTAGTGKAVKRRPSRQASLYRVRGKLIVLCLASAVAVCYLALAIAPNAPEHRTRALILSIAARNAGREASVTLPSRLELATATSNPTATTLPTATPQPTATPASTATPQPTATPIRIPTATPVQAPTATPQPVATPSTTNQAGRVSGLAVLAILGLVLLVALVVMMIILLVRRNGPPPSGPGTGTAPPTAAPPETAQPVPPLEQQQPNVYRQVEWGQVREAQWREPPASGLPPIPGHTESPTWTGSSSETTQPGSYDPGEIQAPPESPNGHN